MTVPAEASLADRLLARFLWLLPTRLISHAAGALATSRLPWLKRTLIRAFLRAYPAIDMSEAAEPDAERYASFNAFFTRELAAGVRPLPASADRIISPVDGQLGTFGTIHAGNLCQTKGATYDVRQLLGGDDAAAAAFLGGQYATLYLAPPDYHRVHMPLDGCVRETRYVPGRLFGVNPRCVRAVPRLFSRNERLVTCFDTAVGPVALVMVGAFIVGGMHTRANGRVCPPHQRAPRPTSFVDAPVDQVYYERGSEMGYFSMGSSVILLFGPGALTWDATLASAQPLRLGQAIATLGTGT